MKTIIAGSRDGVTRADVERAIANAPWTVTHVVSGMARGADAHGHAIARERGLPVSEFPVTAQDWAEHGRSAGPRRNRNMAMEADALIAVWDGKSRGTANMIEEARRHGLQVHVEPMLDSDAALHRHEWIEERAGRLEFDAGIPRAMAEQWAREQWDELQAAKAREEGQ